MVLPAHDLGSHVSWSATGVSTIIWLDQSSNSQICYSEITLFIKYQVLRLNISMNNIIQVQELQTNKYTPYEELSLHLFKSTPISHMVAQVTSNKQIHY